MAVSLDDKLLGEKAHYYCSSSSEDEEESDGQNDNDASSEQAMSIPNVTSYTGHCKNVCLFLTA